MEMEPFPMKNWIKITFTPEEVVRGKPEEVELERSQTVDAASGHEMIDVSLFEQEPRRVDGSRVFFFTPNALNYFKGTIESCAWELCEPPKRSDVRNVGWFIDSLWLNDLL